MGGGGKGKQTIGYWYKLAIHFGWCKGPIDALLEIRGGDRVAWSGAQTASGTITINKPSLWGGEKSEGGIVSDFDVMLGEDTQTPNSFLTTTFGSEQSAYRGKATGVFKGGKYGAFNPYPKPMAFKIRRILKGWDDDTCWYPEKATILIPLSEPVVVDADVALHSHTNAGLTSAVGITLSGFTTEQAIRVDFPSGLTYDAWTYVAAGTDWYCSFWVTDADGNTTSYETLTGESTAAAARAARQALGSVDFHGSTEYTFWLYDSFVADNLGGMSLRVSTYDALKAMNPAHILYDTITSTDGQGEPIGQVNDASFRAAADTLYAEGFGLCCMYDGSQSIEQFQQYICDTIGAALTQSRVTGEYYLDLIRPDYDVGDLLILTEADVVEFSEEPAVLTDAVNEVLVDWFDPETRQNRTTTPVQALGLIQSAGQVISETRTYRCIPYEDLAVRVAARDLRAKSSPQSRFNLICNRTLSSLRPGQPFRLQMPSEGITDMVCRLGSIDHGTHGNGRLRIVALQDVFSLPDTTSIISSPGLAEAPGSAVPAAAASELVYEAPYTELAQVLTTADLEALSDEASYLQTVGSRPHADTLNYSLNTASDGEDYVDRGAADWCPTAVVVEAATIDTAETNFTLSSGVDLDLVEVGTAALWGGEICRVDAIDATLLTIELARGCADTVPAVHSAGERIWFYDDFAGADGREYVDGEIVHAKLLTRTAADELALASATELTVTMAGRAARPYAPGQFEVNGSVAPGSITGDITVTWVHRSRLVQLDQLVESAAATVGPEPGTQYVVTLKNNVGTVLHESDPITGTSYVFRYTYSGTASIELKAVRGALDSWQSHSVSFSYTGASTIIPSVPSGGGTALDPLDGTETVVITQDGVEKDCDVQQIADLAHHFAVASGTDTITATFDPVITLADGLELRVRAAAANATTTPTFNPNSLGALTIYKHGGQALVAGDIYGAGHELRLAYRASPARYELLNPAAGGTGGSTVINGVQYVIDTGSTADSDPGNGLLKYNHATQASATFLYLDDLTDDAVTITAMWAALVAGGFVYIQSASNQDTWQIWSLSSVVDASGYAKFGVTLIADGGAFADGELVLVTVQQGASGTGQSAIQFKDEGSSIGSSGAVTAVDFTGAGVTASHSSGTVTVNIPGGSGSTSRGSATAGSAVTSFSVSGLDLDTDKRWRIPFSIESAGTLCSLYLYYNSDTTNSNYRVQLLKGTGSAASATNSANGSFGNLQANETTTGIIEIMKDRDGKPRAFIRAADGDGDSGMVIWATVHNWTVATTNVTGVTLLADVANQIKTGSTFEVFTD